MTQSPTTITGAQFRDFYHNHWPKGWYVEDMPLSIEDEEGNLLVTADAQVDLSRCGYAQWDGGADGKDLLRGEETRTHSVDMAVFYARVMNAQPETALLVIKGTPEQIAEMRTLAQQAGLTLVD